jgi:hippurate hydrolase
MNRFVTLAVAAAFGLTIARAAAAQGPSAEELDALTKQLEPLYVDLHRTPELSMQEQQTGAKMAQRLRSLGFDVTEHVGGTGVVGLLRNGDGPVVMIRTELDALPVAEQTGLPFASTARMKDRAGNDVPVMHACGHDLHMTTWVATATWLSGHKDRWHGTLMMVGQPGEETGEGAPAMLKDGLFTRFPRPSYAIAIHDDSTIPVGKIGYHAGPAMSAADNVDITIFGRGGHGAMPQATVDPIVIAARTVLALQTIVSREMDPTDPTVITVGSIHGGTKHNIIPDEVHLQLSVRSFSAATRAHLLASIERIAKAEAAAAGAPKPPVIGDAVAGQLTVNDPALTRRVAAVLKQALGDQNVFEQAPKMVSEDFSEYGRAGVPAFIFHVGAVVPAKYDASVADGTPLPALHSSLWAPDFRGTLPIGVRAEVAAALDLFGR